MGNSKKTCAWCVRYTENMKIPGTFRCTLLNGPNHIEANTPACSKYWDRKAHDAEIRESLIQMEREREKVRAKTRDNPPAPPEWESCWNEMSGELSGEMPLCPNCHEPLYEPDRCYFCGQRILMDEKLEEFEKPPEEESMDCFICGGKGTVFCTRSKFNGHLSGECTKCGMRFME